MRFAIFAAIICPTVVLAQVNASITDATGGAYIEGVLMGYTVQANGQTICDDPIAYGRYIACSGKSSHRVWVDANGTLGAYVVVNENGQALCNDPAVYNDFRGGNYIVCE